MNCCNHNDNFDNNTCKPVFHPTRHIFCIGPTGATGPTGPTGPSKSLGNFFTVRDIAAQFPYEVIRFFILNGHYRSPINFSRDLMQACQNGLERIKNARKELAFYIENCAEIGRASCRERV